MMSTSALRRAITTDACRTNNTTDSTRRSARSSPVQALRFWRIRRDVPPSSWERPVSTATRRNSPARSRSRILPLSRTFSKRDVLFNISQLIVLLSFTILPWRKSWRIIDNKYPNSSFLRPSAVPVLRDTTCGKRSSKSWSDS